MKLKFAGAAALGAADAGVAALLSAMARFL